MPSVESTSRNARKCSGSLLAMTPSKSNTTALTGRRLPFGLDALAGFDSDRQPVLLRRQRTDVPGAEVAVGVVGEIEVDLIQAGSCAIEVEVAARRVGFLTAGLV